MFEIFSAANIPFAFLNRKYYQIVIKVVKLIIQV